MQLVKTLFWIVLAMGLTIFAGANWETVTIVLWDRTEADMKLPVLEIGPLVFGILLGSLPTVAAILTRHWAQFRRAISGIGSSIHTLLTHGMLGRRRGLTGLLAIAAVLAAAAYLDPGSEESPTATSPSDGNFACTVATITDGDTFNCLEQSADGRPIRVRLSGIAARESDGTCSPGHPCPDASAEAATTELERLAAGQSLNCQSVGSTYGRVAAFCQRDDGVDLSCAMVASGAALRWDTVWAGHQC
jgi:endonuclease YncB( thermonuclease family)